MINIKLHLNNYLNSFPKNPFFSSLTGCNTGGVICFSGCATGLSRGLFFAIARRTLSLASFESVSRMSSGISNILPAMNSFNSGLSFP